MNNRILVQSTPRSGGTVYLLQCFPDHKTKFNEPFTYKNHKRVETNGAQDLKSWLERNTLTRPIIVKVHPNMIKEETLYTLPDWFEQYPWHRITLVRRNLFEQTLSLSLAMDKLETFKDITKNGSVTYYKPGPHENVRWYVSTRVFKKAMHVMIMMYRDLFKMPRNELVYFEELDLKPDGLLQKPKSQTISNIDELKEIWYDTYTTTQPHLDQVDLNN